MEKLILKAIVCLKNLLESNYLVDFTIDYKNSLFLLTHKKENTSIKTHYKSQNSRDNYDVYKVEGSNIVHKFCVKDISIDLHFIRVIGDKYLLASSRCDYIDEDNIEKNILILNQNGTIIDTFIFGDGIEDIKVEQSGVIWTSYFDEGIFGNYGWLNPIGISGLRSWSSNGESLYEYEGEYSIYDCYGLNIDAHNNKWFYFYTEFYLGKITGNKIRYYSIDVNGANTIAINEKFIVSDSGYAGNNFILHSIAKDKLIKILEFDLVDFDKDKSINILKSTAYQDKVLLLAEDKIFMFKIDDVRTNLNII